MGGRPRGPGRGLQHLALGHTARDPWPAHTGGRLPRRRRHVESTPAHFGGDGDTIQQGGYGYRDDFSVSYLSVYRQTVDLAAIDQARWIVPGGVSGVPGSPHFSDQLERWRVHDRAPMRYAEADIARDTQQELRLLPRG